MGTRLPMVGVIHCFLLAGMSGTLWSGGSREEAFWCSCSCYMDWFGGVRLITDYISCL